jgi:rubrerythrin
MALQLCPKCRTKSITWFIDEDVTLNTIWNCQTCGYTAEEYEAKAARCPLPKL